MKKKKLVEYIFSGSDYKDNCKKPKTKTNNIMAEREIQLACR